MKGSSRLLRLDIDCCLFVAGPEQASRLAGPAPAFRKAARLGSAVRAVMAHQSLGDSLRWISVRFSDHHTNIKLVVCVVSMRLLGGSLIRTGGPRKQG